MLNQFFKFIPRKYLLFLIATFTIYIVLILLSPHQLIYDEVYYVKIAQDFLIYKLSYDFIYNIYAPTGILYALTHYVFYPLTQYQPPNIRFVNLLLLLISYIVIFLSLKIIHKQETKVALLNSIPWLVFPTTGVISGMALTELPAITLFVGSSFLLGIAYNNGNWRSQSSSLLYLTISGILLGLSTWGRQNFIVALVATLFIFLPINRKSLIFSLTYAIPALVIFLYPLSIWHGLVPPSVKFVEEGYRFSNFFLSLGYLGVYSLIIFPEFILSKDRQTFLSLSVMSLILVLIFPDLRYAPSQFLLERLFGTFIKNVIAYCFGILLVFISLLLVYSIYLQIRKIKKNNDSNLTMYIYYSLVLIAICFSNIKITHQFSSRYITLALPFLVYIVGANNFLSKDKFVFYRFTFSFVLSIIFILNYYGFLLP